MKSARIFFLACFAFEVPSNVIMERVGARLWMARIMCSAARPAAYSCCLGLAHGFFPVSLM